MPGKAKQKSFTFDGDRSVYHDLMQYRETGGDMVERIKAIGVTHVFQPLIEAYGGDMESFNGALFYILSLYSKDSEKLVTGLGYTEVKGGIAAELGITGKLYADLIELRRKEVLDTVNNYLDLQTSRIYVHLTMLRELYHTMVRNSTLVPAGDAATDYEQMRKNSKHAAELFEEVRQWEQKLTEEERLLKHGHLEMQKKQRGKRVRHTSLRIEDLAREVKEEEETEDE